MLQQRSGGFPSLDKNESLETIRQNFSSIKTIMENSTKLSELSDIKNINKSLSLIFFSLFYFYMNVFDLIIVSRFFHYQRFVKIF